MTTNRGSPVGFLFGVKRNASSHIKHYAPSLSLPLLQSGCHSASSSETTWSSLLDVVALQAVPHVKLHGDVCL